LGAKDVNHRSETNRLEFEHGNLIAQICVSYKDLDHAMTSLVWWVVYITDEEGWFVCYQMFGDSEPVNFFKLYIQYPMGPADQFQPHVDRSRMSVGTRRSTNANASVGFDWFCHIVTQ
jgi:hypothetical protein